RAPVAAALIEVRGIRHLEQATPVRVDRVEVEVVGRDQEVALEHDLPAVRRPDRLLAADGGRIGDRTPAAEYRDLPQTAAVRVDRPDRASVRIRDVSREQDLVSLRRPAPAAEVVADPRGRDLP